VNVRPITSDDFPAVAAFLADDETHLFDRPSRLGVADITAWLSGPDLAHDSWLYEEDAGVVAVGWVESHDDTGVAIGIVHRECRGRGLGSELVDRGEERLRALGMGRVHAVTLAPDVAAEPLLTGRGYREVRRFWEMTIELGDDPPPAPQLPEGFRIEPFSSEQARAFHGALDGEAPDGFEPGRAPALERGRVGERLEQCRSEARGIARGLMQQAIARAPELGLTTLLGFVFAHNTGSVALCERFGFQRWGLLPRVAVLDGVERDLLILGLRLGLDTPS